MGVYTRKNPFFSIITCTLNAEKYLEENLGSVNRQTYTDFEHIIIDGMSTDNTIKVIDQFKKKFRNKIKVVSRPPRGIWNAINLGNKYASGKYILHLESDNSLIGERVLEDVHNFLIENSFPDWIYGKIKVINEGGRIVGSFPERKIFQISSSFILNFFNFIPQEAMFVQKRVFNENGKFNEHLPTAMDYDMWLRIKDKTNWLFFNKSITKYRIHNESITGNPVFKNRNFNNQLEVQKKYLNWLEYRISFFIGLLSKKYNKNY